MKTLLKRNIEKERNKERGQMKADWYLDRDICTRRAKVLISLKHEKQHKNNIKL